jgi:hypothetical protein
MSVDFRKLLKLSNRLEKKSLEFCTSFENLLAVFGKICSKNQDFMQLCEYWKIAKRVAGVSTCGYEISSRINMYYEDILAENVEKLYNEDYSKYIIRGTSKSTVDLINSLILIFRQAWDIADQENRDLIKKYFKELAKISPDIISLEEKINGKKK